MSTERKSEQHPVTDTEKRNATGDKARDEQGSATLGGSQRWNENWQETSTDLRKKYDQLTEQDLELKPGKEHEMLDRVGKRLGRSTVETHQLVQETATRHQKHQSNSSASTAGQHSVGTHSGHTDMPEAAERKARRDAPHSEQRQEKPKA